MFDWEDKLSIKDHNTSSMVEDPLINYNLFVSYKMKFIDSLRRKLKLIKLLHELYYKKKKHVNIWWTPTM